jgi:hypothetical protein
MTGASKLILQPLRVFLCHSSGDRAPVRELYQKLKADAVIPWLDKEDLLPGQNWDLEIKNAIQKSDVVLICLSRSSVTKEGYIQKEIRLALDVADEKPEGVIFLIPVKLEECDVPKRLSRYHWANLSEQRGYEKLLCALQTRASQLAAIEVAGQREIEGPPPTADLPQRLDDLDRVLNLLLRPAEREHLRNLEKGDTEGYVGRHSLRAELRNLRALGLLETSPARTIGEMTDQRRFDLKDFATLTHIGREYLKRAASFPGHV